MSTSELRILMCGDRKRKVSEEKQPRSPECYPLSVVPIPEDSDSGQFRDPCECGSRKSGKQEESLLQLLNCPLPRSPPQAFVYICLSICLFFF